MNTYISSTLLLTSVLRVRLVPNPYMNESCHTYEWVMSHMHVHTHTLRTSLLNWNSSRKKFKYTHAHIQTHIRHYMCMDIYIYSSRTLSLTGVVWLRLVPNPYKNETCHKHEWVMSHMHIYSYPSKTLSLTGVLRWRLVPHPTSPALSAVPLPGVYVREYVCVHVYILRKDVNMRISLRLRLVPYSTLLVLSDVPRTGVYVRKYLYLWADKYYVWIYMCIYMSRLVPHSSCPTLLAVPPPGVYATECVCVHVCTRIQMSRLVLHSISLLLSADLLPGVNAHVIIIITNKS